MASVHALPNAASLWFATSQIQPRKVSLNWWSCGLSRFLCLCLCLCWPAQSWSLCHCNSVESPSRARRSSQLFIHVPPHPRRSPGPLRQTPVGVISAAASSQQLPDDDLLLPLGIFLQKSQTVCYCHKVEGAHAERAVAQLLCIRLMCCLQRLGSRYPSTSVSLVVPPCCCPGPPIYLVNCTLWSSMQALT